MHDSRSVNEVASAPGPAGSLERQATGRNRDHLSLYRLLASFPWLSSYRAKIFAVLLAGAFVPAFLLMLSMVLGAGRMSVLGVLVLVMLLAALSAGFMLWGVDRLLTPLDLAVEAIDGIALEQPLSRAELPGSDAAAQILRGVQSLAARIENESATARQRSERDALTGLWNRRSGREHGQRMIDRDTHRGRVVRALLANVNGFSAFNATHGTGHGDALLQAIGSRLEQLAGKEGVAIRWHGATFLLLQSSAADDLPDEHEMLGRPMIVKGVQEPVTLALGAAQTEVKLPIDSLLAQAEAALSTVRNPLRAAGV